MDSSKPLTFIYIVLYIYYIHVWGDEHRFISYLGVHQDSCILCSISFTIAWNYIR